MEGPWKGPWEGPWEGPEISNFRRKCFYHVGGFKIIIEALIGLKYSVEVRGSMGGSLGGSMGGSLGGVRVQSITCIQDVVSVEWECLYTMCRRE